MANGQWIFILFSFTQDQDNRNSNKTMNQMTLLLKLLRRLSLLLEPHCFLLVHIWDFHLGLPCLEFHGELKTLDAALHTLRVRGDSLGVWGRKWESFLPVFRDGGPGDCTQDTAHT